MDTRSNALGAPPPPHDGRWAVASDFVESVAEVLGLSGWSLGIRASTHVATLTRGFAPGVAAAYALLELDEELPGPVTLRTGVDQFFRDPAEARRRYPAVAGIVDGSPHRAAATLLLRRPGDAAALGFLALHFRTDRDFDDLERQRLRRVADTIGDGVGHALARSTSTAR